MDRTERLARRFEEDRPHLRAVAYRLLGSAAEADDAVQEAWLRLSRSDTSDVANLTGWLTTVVGRISLDMLRSRTSRREAPLEAERSDAVDHAAPDPEAAAVQADAVGTALLVVLDQLAPAERLAFVLHDLFGVPFEDIGPIVGRSTTASRQLASRARRRVRGAGDDAGAEPDPARQRQVVEAFLAASREGDFAGLLALLDPDVVLTADRAAVAAATVNAAKGAPELAPEVRGAGAVAEAFAGRAAYATTALVDGAWGAVWASDGAARAVFAFTVERGRIVGIDLVLNQTTVREMDVQLVP
ncbi:RNA polymerase, sigma-24 subunit, ECF subfamily [Beutenbergia cavernae DSM 12333]|uniref:RNA polymerase, sigma-24 subunit, ECF subfamily n=1 Tax=Beutenbergia cavernae (strain ATCC BAA-8 / DSM 12333 / CCUG 43141 / JCM 11478 / NBRC 16432 / NCIMB 13614 / HKI 0122) TaxID=471853 RepID=C5BWK5_BEUC1|nr:sigma-70 family RNA polymerase sigma factor [Beutenbergia cavernae]ACQ78663.1 RNA polymerase, sigma-24 subunit, ECF subfamily [Beutenbergia cavernae DSM 12333]